MLDKLNQEIKMTSLQLAEVTGKQHKNIIRDIRTEIDQLSGYGAELIFEPSEYKDSTGRSLPMYTMGKKGAMQLALKYDAVTRYRVINYIEELENKKPALPNYAEALRQLADSLEQNEEFKRELEETRPKAMFADSVSASESTILIRDLAKILKGNGIDIGEKRLFVWMRENGYLIKQRGRDYNSPTQKAMNMGLFRIKENTITHSNGKISINKTPLVTGKGQTYFIKKFFHQMEGLKLKLT